MKVLLLYFSATGNTRYVMHVLAEKLMAHHALVSCLDMEENDHITESMDYLVIGYPKYCEKVPPYVETYVRNCLIKQPVEIPTLLMTTQVGPTKVCTHPLKKILKEKNVKLSELRTCMTKYPQILINIRLTNKAMTLFADNENIKGSIKKAETELSDTGRILVRTSGTEPLVRVMVEGKSESEISRIANEVAEVVKAELSEV